MPPDRESTLVDRHDEGRETKKGRKSHGITEKMFGMGTGTFAARSDQQMKQEK